MNTFAEYQDLSESRSTWPTWGSVETRLVVGLDPGPTPTRLTQLSCHAAVMARHTRQQQHLGESACSMEVQPSKCDSLHHQQVFMIA